MDDTFPFHQRKPMRHREYDYGAPCTVHVTICTWRRQPLFGTVVEAGMHPSSAGQMVERTIASMSSTERGILIDTHMVMPDHVHLLICLGTNPMVDSPDTIASVVEGFKVRVLRSWANGVQRLEWPRYAVHLWQRSYYDTIIRDERQMDATRAYILDNPRRWFVKHTES